MVSSSSSSSLPSAHPGLALHLTDRALTPLISSARTQSQATALASVTATSLVAHETAARLGLGLPQRIMVEQYDNGPVLLQSFLNPGAAASSSSSAQPPPPPTGASAAATSVNGTSSAGATDSTAGAVAAPGSLGVDPDADMDAAEDGVSAPPMLLGIVVAPRGDEARAARQAAARLERVGREVQSKWAEEQQAGEDPGAGG